MRIDKWLWFARFYKTRSLAARMVEEGEILLNGAPVTKPSREVVPGDQIALPMGKTLVRIQVKAEGERRGPTPEARLLYDQLGVARIDSLGFEES